MDRKEIDQLSRLSPLQLVLLAIGASALAAVAMLFMIGIKRRSGSPRGPGSDRHAAAEPDLYKEEVPVQPAVDTVMQADIPDHFTEDLIVPGFTETGAEIQKDDETLGRSPEGA
jgi:hypothetical protein